MRVLRWKQNKSRNRDIHVVIEFSWFDLNRLITEINNNYSVKTPKINTLIYQLIEVRDQAEEPT